MMKKAFALMVMLLSVPVFASAYNCWSVTKAASPSTAITINGIVGPAATDPGVYPGISLSASATTPGVVTYATTATAAACTANDVVQSMDFEVNAAGYAVTQVRLDGVVLPAVNGKYTVPRLVGKTNRNLLVYYAPLASAYTITTQPSGGGSVTPSFKTAATSTPKVYVTPFQGYMLTGLTITPAVTYDLEQVKSQGYFEFPAVTQNYTFKASFAAAPKASALLSTNLFTIAPNAVALLDGTMSYSNVAGTTYVWSVSPSANATLTPDNKTANFSASVAGDYVVTLTLGNTGLSPAPSASLTIKVGAPPSTCVNCHIQGDPQVIADYQASAHVTGEHAAYGPSCVRCHAPPGSNVSHPYFDKTAAIASCVGCHTGTHAPHNGQFSATPAVCVTCHDPHSLQSAPVPTSHYGGQAFHKAQYVSDASLPVSCASCHSDSPQPVVYQAILGQFAASAHGNVNSEAWVHFDWRSANRAPCQRCHTGTAFVAKLGDENSTANAYQSGDVLKPGEVLNCSACHSNVGTGALRQPSGSFTINMTNGAVTYDVSGASTLCARCHGGRETGDSIKNDPNTTGIRGFIDPHYLAAAGILYNQGGYEYAGQTYNSLGSHYQIGSDSAGQGPCVSCHMSGKNHTFVAGTSACVTCHSDKNAAALNAEFAAGLDSLKTALAAKDIHYSPVHPFFYTAPYVAGGPNTAVTNWAAPYGAGAWKDVMGAAFNYRLLMNEPGAYAHNHDYAMKLIDDSVDFINDGAINGN